MSKTERFSDDFEAWEAHNNGFPAGADASTRLAHSKQGIEMFRALHEKWRPRFPEHSEIPPMLDELEVEYALPLERWVEAVYWADLQAFLGWRRTWFATEWMLKVFLAQDPTMEDTPEPFRSTMEKRLAGRREGDRGPAAIRQEVENMLGEVGEEVQKHHHDLVADFPERMGARMRERIAKLDDVDAAAWLAEIAVVLGSTAPVIPPMFGWPGTVDLLPEAVGDGAIFDPATGLLTVPKMPAHTTFLRAYRQVAGGPPEQAGISHTTSVSVGSDSPLTPGVKYEFWCVGVNHRGEGPASNKISFHA